MRPNAQVHRAGASPLDEAETHVCAGSGATASWAAYRRKHASAGSVLRLDGEPNMPRKREDANPQASIAVNINGDNAVLWPSKRNSVGG